MILLIALTALVAAQDVLITSETQGADPWRIDINTGELADQRLTITTSSHQIGVAFC